MVEPTIDRIKDTTVERQIRKLAGIIDEQNDTISKYGDASSDIETLKTNDAKQTADINNLNNTVAPIPEQIQSLIDTDANQTTQINNLKQSIATDKLATEAAITELQSKDASQDGTLANHATLIQGITKSLVSDVQIMSGTTTGDIKIRLERESAAAIDSNDYNLGLPISAEIIQGTGPSMFKIQITMSTGVKVVSNDFVFTTEAIGNDVYISSFTFKAGNQPGYLSADIGLNNGVTIEANNFLVPTDPNVTSAITDLQSRLTTVENETTDISGLKTTVSEHTTAINELNTDVANLMTNKADVNNSSQSITAGTINANNINKNGVSVATVNDIPSVPDISGKADLNNSSQTIVAGTINATNINKNGVAVATTNDIPNINGKVDKAQGVGNAGKVLGINASGNVEPMNVSGGEVWETVDLSNFPKNWVAGDKVKIIFKQAINQSSVGEWKTAPITNGTNQNNTSGGAIFEFELGTSSASACLVGFNTYSVPPNSIGLVIAKSTNVADWNGANNYIMFLFSIAFNGNTCVNETKTINRTEVSTYVQKMWRLKK